MRAPQKMARLLSDSNSTGIARQKGAALMIMMLIMVLGTSWVLVNAISGASRNTVSEQKQTSETLLLAKNALLGYLAQQAASESDSPGMFPCPESTSSIAIGSEGTPSTNCNTLPAIGRLPWKKIGMDKPVDGAGEVLWYVVGSSARTEPINFSSTGSLTMDGTAAMAVIIAPGAPLDTASSTATATSPCVKRDQSNGRKSVPSDPNASISLDSRDYVECGNDAFVTSRSDTWGNDRVIAITAAEMSKAIEGAVADRIQRKVAPALNGTAAATGWYQNDSSSEWGTPFFPYASSWPLSTDPTANDYCGDNGTTEGFLPIASGNVTSGTTCSARWTSATATKLSGSGSFSGVSCTANTTRIRCSFTYSGRPVVLMTANASNIAMGFRTAPTTSQITFTPSTGNSISSLTPSIVTATGGGQVVLQVTMANKSSSGTGRINIPHPSDSYLINTSTTSNPDLAWFINNKWNYYTYYAISPAVTVNPSGTCTSANVTNCLTLTNAEAGTGNVNDKRIALVFSSRPLTGKTYPSVNMSDYFEAQNDQTSSPGDRTFQRDTISTFFNDRPSVCPYQQATGSATVLCN